MQFTIQQANRTQLFKIKANIIIYSENNSQKINERLHWNYNAIVFIGINANSNLLDPYTFFSGLWLPLISRLSCHTW